MAIVEDGDEVLGLDLKGFVDECMIPKEREKELVS